MYRVFVDDGQNASRTFEAETWEEVEKIKKEWEYLDADGKLHTLVWRTEEIQLRAVCPKED